MPNPQMALIAAQMEINEHNRQIQESKDSLIDLLSTLISIIPGAYISKSVYKELKNMRYSKLISTITSVITFLLMYGISKTTIDEIIKRYKNNTGNSFGKRKQRRSRRSRRRF